MKFVLRLAFGLLVSGTSAGCRRQRQRETSVARGPRLLGPAMGGTLSSLAAAPVLDLRPPPLDGLPLLAAVATEPRAPQGQPPRPPPNAVAVVQGPAPEAVAEARLSLSPEARLSAPDPATLPFYDFELLIDPEKGRITGRETIDYPNPTVHALTSLPLRIFANDRNQAFVEIDRLSQGGRELSKASPEPSMIEVQLRAPVPPGGWTRIELEFEGRAPAPKASSATPGGFGLIQSLLSGPGQAPDYGLFSTFSGGIALAEWLPMVAGRWMGHFDRQPPSGLGDSSYFDLSSFRGRVQLPTAYELATPGVTVAEEILAGHSRRTTFALADARDLPLFASEHYRVAEAVEGGVRVRSIYVEGEGEAGRSVLDTSRRALALFSRLYHPYPYVTFTSVEVPLRGGAGGAEFPSLIAVAGMAYGEGGDLPEGLEFTAGYLTELREFVVAHEVAHQWWACAVASQPRAQPDVDEPLAQFSAAVYVGHARGEGARRAILGSQVAVNYQAMRLLGVADGPAARATGAFANSAEYAGLVYGKAPLYYQALADRYGDDRVQKGLAAYAGAHWLGLARRGDTVGPMAKVAWVPEGQVKALFDRWFHAAHGDADLSGLGEVKTVAAEAFGAEVASGEGLDVGALFKQLGGGGAPGRSPAASGGLPQGVDPAQLQKLLEQLNQTMGGVDSEGLP